MIESWSGSSVFFALLLFFITLAAGSFFMLRIFMRRMTNASAFLLSLFVSGSYRFLCNVNAADAAGSLFLIFSSGRFLMGVKHVNTSQMDHRVFSNDGFVLYQKQK